MKRDTIDVKLLCLNEGNERRRIDTCLHDSFNPSSFVIVFKALGCGVRPMEISVKEKEMVGKHDEQPTRDQYQIQVFLVKLHVWDWVFSNQSYSLSLAASFINMGHGSRDGEYPSSSFTYKFLICLKRCSLFRDWAIKCNLLCFEIIRWYS